MKPNEHSDITGGIILIIIGLLFLISNITGFNIWNLLGTYWPVILVIIGIIILVKNQKN